jgi:hypothetical protein
LEVALGYIGHHPNIAHLSGFEASSDGRSSVEKHNIAPLAKELEKGIQR